MLAPFLLPRIRRAGRKKVQRRREIFFAIYRPDRPINSVLGCEPRRGSDIAGWKAPGGDGPNRGWKVTKRAARSRSQ
jgi:hypothetical protein